MLLRSNDTHTQDREGQVLQVQFYLVALLPDIPPSFTSLIIVLG
jgi:hypothetical protein